MISLFAKLFLSPRWLMQGTVLVCAYVFVCVCVCAHIWRKKESVDKIVSKCSGVQLKWSFSF